MSELDELRGQLALYKRWLEVAEQKIRDLEYELRARQVAETRKRTQYDDKECHACGRPLALCTCAE